MHLPRRVVSKLISLRLKIKLKVNQTLFFIFTQIHEIMATKTQQIAVEIPQEPIEIVVHDPKQTKRTQAAVELMAFHPEVFTEGVLQEIRLDVPWLNPTEAAIVMEAAPIITQWKDFMIFIFQLYPHDRVAQNMKRVEHLWPHVLRLQGKDPDAQ